MSGRLEAVVPDALVGERVDRAVALLAEISRSAAGRLVASGAVEIDGEVVHVGSARLRGGELLVVDVPAPASARPSADPRVGVAVVHEDPNLVVVDKPAGMVVHPGSGRAEGTLVNGLLARYPEMADVGEPERPGIVHRLDRGTSGLLVVARDQPTYEGLVAQLSAREPVRVYTALVWGRVDSDRGTVDAPIGRSARHPTRMTVASGGRPAVTHYTVRRRFARPRPVSLLSCRLETGRTHQIRVHLRAIGHPLVGDRDYGGSRPGLDLARPFLHAGELRFRHPLTGAPIAVTAGLPPELVEVLAACGDEGQPSSGAGQGA